MTTPGTDNDGTEPDHALLTAEGALARAEFWKAATRAEYLELGRLGDNPRAILSCRRLVKSGPPQVEVGPILAYPVERPLFIPAAIAHRLGRDEHAACLAMIARDMAKFCEACGFLLMMDAWFLYREASRAELPLQGQVKDQLDRREGVFVLLEHEKAGRRVWTAEISRDPLRLGDWLELPPHEGRFKGIIPGTASDN